MRFALHVAPRFGVLAIAVLLAAAVPSAQAIGMVTAWGDDSFHQVSDAPKGHDFVDVSAGAFFGLALRSNGSLKAWGDNNYDEVSAAPKTGGFVAISAGAHHAYALRSDGSLVFWGYGYGALPTSHDFVVVDGGYSTAVALWSDGRLAVWGDDSYGGVSLAPKGRGFIDAVAGYSFGRLALRANGSILAWGNDPSGTTAATPTGRGFEAIERGYSMGHAIHSIPEPATYALMLLGLAGFGFAARRRASRPNPPTGNK